jgi:hypothetical protein
MGNKNTVDPKSWWDFMLSGLDTPGFLFLGVCEANILQCSYSQHPELETANQGSYCMSLLMFLAECGRKWNKA